MKSSVLNKLITGRISGKEFSALIKDEIITYSTLIKKKGSGIPLVFHENEEVVIDHISLERILREVLNGSLNSLELAYICDCLTLGEKVRYSEGKFEDIIFEIADPEINGGFRTISEIQELIYQINN